MREAVCIIDGRETVTTDTLDVLNPSTGATLAIAARGGDQEIDAAVKAARNASGSWCRLSTSQRSPILRRLAQLIQRDAETLAITESQDTGKPLSQARMDVTVAARYFEYYAGVSEAFFGDVIPASTDVMAYTRHLPWGVTGHIIPWNYPLQIASRTLAPALAVGNCCVIKPAEEAPLTVIELGKLALEAGVPPGVLNVVPGLGEEAGTALSHHDGINHLSFTGSVAVGSMVATAASERVVPVALELGGKSPNIVFPDADLEVAVPTVVKSVLQNAGQTCSAGSRLLVHADIHDRVVAKIAERFREVRIGPGPSDPDLGPLISAKQLERVAAFVTDAAGANPPTVGGFPVSGRDLEGGFYYAPTLFDDVDASSPIAREEVFGPVVAVVPFRDIDEAVTLANSTEYGLIAAVWTNDVNTMYRLIDDVVAGQIYVNSFGAGGGVEFPFGGFGKSGYGREKGFEALRTFSQTKSVIVKLRP